MLKKKPEIFHFIVLFFLVFLTYQESLNNYFLADDALWIMQAEKAGQSFAQFFHPVGGFLRPMVTFIYFVINKFFHLNPSPYYFFCVSLHFINCIVIYYFCLEFFRVVQGKEEKNTSFLSAVLFSVLYSHCEAVIWVGAFGDSLLLLFCLLSFIFFMKSLEKAALYDFLLLSLIFYFFSLLSKETAFVFPALLLTFVVMFKKEKYKRVFPHILLTFIYAAFYKKMMSSVSFLDLGNATFIIPSILRAFKIMIVSFLGFGDNIIWIFDEVNAQLSFPKMILQCMTVGGVVLYSYTCSRKKTFRFNGAPDTRKILLFFACFIAIAYMPVAVHVKPERAVGDVSQTSSRYFYFPDAGFCILSALVLCKVFQRYKNFVLQNVFVISLVAVNIICVYQTQWSYNFLGGTRKHIIERVVSLHTRYKNHPYILLIDYPGQIAVHLHTYTLLPLFQLYDKNVYFALKETVYDKVKNLTLNQVCFFEWANVTFVDKTAEYVHAIEKQRQQERLKAYRKIQSK